MVAQMPVECGTSIKEEPNIVRISGFYNSSE